MRAAPPPRRILRLDVKAVSAALPGSSTPPSIGAAAAPSTQPAHAASKPSASGLADIPRAPGGGGDGMTTGGNYDGATPPLRPLPNTMIEAAAAAAEKLKP